MEKGLLNGVVFIDLGKAFDMADTKLLLKKLAIYKCDDLALSWFTSYLQGRDQSVQLQINGTLSSKKPTLYGAPQGSIIRPLCL